MYSQRPLPAPKQRRWWQEAAAAAAAAAAAVAVAVAAVDAVGANCGRWLRQYDVFTFAEHVAPQFLENSSRA